MVEHQLRGHSLVELTSVNKALLGRQPKLLNHFSHQFVYFKFARFNFSCFNFDVFVFQCSEVLRCGKGEIAWKALCRPWGGVEVNAGSFLHLENFCKNPSLWSRECGDVEKKPLRSVATLGSTS